MGCPAISPGNSPLNRHFQCRLLIPVTTIPAACVSSNSASRALSLLTSKHKCAHWNHQSASPGYIRKHFALSIFMDTSWASVDHVCILFFSVYKLFSVYNGFLLYIFIDSSPEVSLSVPFKNSFSYLLFNHLYEWFSFILHKYFVLSKAIPSHKSIKLSAS